MKKTIMKSNQKNHFAFGVLTSLFFLWGFATVCNDILIPFFKDQFDLTHSKANLVQTFFFGAYVVGALIYALISMFYRDPINKIGYKNGIIISLIISGIGALLFLPAADMKSLPMFFLALGVIGFGFSWLQIAANPYVTILGSEQTASSRLNLSQGFNSLGTTLAPFIWGYLIFELLSKTTEGLEAVKMPYLVLAGVFFAMAVVMYFIKLPKFVSSEEQVKEPGALKYRHLLLGALAIFMYVGSEVTIGSNMISFLRLDNIAGMTDSEAAKFVSVYWGGLMIGRLTGSLSLSNASRQMKTIGVIALPVLAFLIMGLISGWNTAFIYSIFLIISLAGFYLGASLPNRTLWIFALVSFLLLLVTLSTEGTTAMWALIGVGLFNSIMWSNIFSLAIEGLGKYKSQGSSLLVMAIGGGAVFPYLQGLIADYHGIHISFALPLIGYAYIMYYGLAGFRRMKNEE
jgi:MFS transporter, FHS family, L-fucose permease